MARHDILLNENSPVITNGDFTVGVSDTQHIQDALQAFPGWWKQYPSDGVGLAAWRNSPGSNQQLTQSIILQNQSDGYSINLSNIIINPVTSKLTIDANI